MKRNVFLGCLILFWASTVFAQEKVDAPVWNVGDKWVFTVGAIEVVNADQNSYTLIFSDDICIYESQRLNLIIIDKSTLNRIYALEGNKRKKYTWGRATFLIFPFLPEKNGNLRFLQQLCLGLLAA